MSPPSAPGLSSLHQAAVDDDAKAIEALLTQGHSPDFRDRHGHTALHIAAQEYAVSAAAALLHAGATVDAEDPFGNTPLFTAVFHSRGRGELIRLLRSQGADPLHGNTGGQTPAGLARLIANYDIAQFFTDLPE